MSRRDAEATQAFLWLLRRRLRPVPPGEGLSLVLDRTGLSLVGAGAWAAAIPGGRGQRGWRTRHGGGDRSGVILVHPLPVRCPPCGRRRAPRSPTSGPIPGERDRFRPLAPPVAVWAAFRGRCAEVAAAAGSAPSRAVGRRWAWPNRARVSSARPEGCAVDPVLLVCEEAHRYVPNRGEAQYEAAQEAIRRIAKEGRKYGVGLLLVSQRPGEVEATVLSQCNSWIVLRVTNDSDREHVKAILPDSMAGLTKIVKGQARHEWQVAPVIIEAIEEGELLRAVGLVFGDIEVDRDQASAPSPAAMAGQHPVGERVAHGAQHPRGRRALEPRDRRLRRQAAALDRVAPQQQFVICLGFGAERPSSWARQRCFPHAF